MRGRVILEAKNLIKHFPLTEGLIFSKQKGSVNALDGISFNIGRSETFALVGESGCGKTTTARLILLLEKPTNGTIHFENKDIQKLSGSELANYRASVQAVFQDPYSSLSPRMRVGEIIGEPIWATNSLPKRAIKERVSEVLELVGLGRDKAVFYPHEFSGGQRQRIAVARAIAVNPGLIVLDEPVSALDVSIRAQIINLLRDIQGKLGMSYLLIAHDLAVVKHMSNRIGVMYLGKLVEVAESQELYQNPLHPYTQALYSAALPSHPDKQREEIILTGEVPSPLNPPMGCRFHTRCFQKKSICSEKEPGLTEVAGSHEVACHLIG